MCLILQSSKVTSIGNQHVDLQPDDTLLASNDLPVVSRITKASNAEPNTTVILSLYMGMVQSFNNQIADSPTSRIARAIHTLRSEFRSPLSVSNFANTAGLSASSFHKHFKSVTGTTPLQYQKELHLIEARASLLERRQFVSETAYAAGYESPTHFSRNDSRKPGVPPSQDGNNINTLPANTLL